jgi:DNA-binding FrmR family transcriptional regulator
MPHSTEDKKRAITRLRRIRGQAEALELAIDTGADCGAVLQQLAAIRGAVNGLMANVLEGHLQETLGTSAADASAREAALRDVAALVRSYLR